MKKAAKTEIVNNSNVKAAKKEERLLKKTATANTNDLIKVHRKILNEIFYCLSDDNLDNSFSAEKHVAILNLTTEYTAKLREICIELQFAKTFAGYNDEQKQIVRKILGI